MVRTIVIAAGVLTGCGAPAGFGCEGDAQCGEGGVCAAPGYCAFSDPACESGLAFGAHAGELAGLCVMPEGGSGGAEGPTTAGASGGLEGTDGPMSTSPGGSTLALDDGSSGATTGDGSVTLTASASSSESSSSTTATDGGDAGTTTGGDPRPFTVELVADLALCAYPDNVDPAPAECAASSGAGAFTVDLEDGSSGLGAAAGYLAFTIGPELEDGTVLEVSLRVRTTAAASALSDHAGEVWRVEPFDLASLAMATPAPVGDAPIAADIGPVGVSADATWTLPLDVLEAGAAIHLAILPVSTDGADYLDASSAVPPVIEATLAP